MLTIGGIAIGGDRPAHPRPRHRPVVQRRDRPSAARRHHQGAGRSRRPGPAATTPSPTCCPGMNVVPGQGVDFAAVGRTLLLALALYLVAALLIWIQARLLNVDRPAHHHGAARRRRGQGAPAAAVLLRLPAARRGAEPGHQRRRQHPDVGVDDDQPAAHLGADRRRGAGDDADDLAAAGADHGGDGAVVAVGDPGDRAALADDCSSRSGPTPAGSTPTSRRPTAASPWSRPSATGPRPRRSSANSTTTSTTPASARSSSPDWSSPATMFIGNLSYVAVAVVGGYPGGDRPDHARQHPGLHPVRAPVQPAADPGRRHVQHAAVRDRQRRAGLRPPRQPRRRRRTRRDAAVATASGPRPGRVRATSASATGRTPR